jgi:diaminopimelate epimerase
MSGAGNLFTVIDDRAGVYSHDLISRMCPLFVRPTKTQAEATEGVLVLRSVHYNETAVVTVDFYNPDGSSSMMCGNGGRCALKFARQVGALAANVNSGILRMANTDFPFLLSDADVTLQFPAPRTALPNVEIPLPEGVVNGAYVDVGSDHVMIEKHEWERVFGKFSAEMFTVLAPNIRSHSMFARGANVSVYERVAMSTIQLWTFERGVEAVTRACGTGALAVSVINTLQSDSGIESWTCIPPGGEPLTCVVQRDAQKNISALFLQGPAVILGEADLVFDNVEFA